MEESKKDPKEIKLATGWERGADGKWRYEVADPDYVSGNDSNGDNLSRLSEIVDNLSPKDKRTYNRYENMSLYDMSERQKNNYKNFLRRVGLDVGTAYLSDKGRPVTLGDVLKGKYADELFKAYPEMKDVKVEYKDLG